MSLTVLQGAVEQGFIYGLVAMALFLSYRTLDIADMSTDGTFVLGAAVCSTLTLSGHPWLGLVLGALGAAVAGGVTALLQTKLGVPSILAGIITMVGLYSINIMAMGGKANQPMLKADNVFTAFEAIFGKNGKLVCAALFALVCAAVLVWFLHTKLGLSLRATGDNRAMVSASSINPALTTTVGLCLANTYTGLAGGLLAQYQKFSDVSMGSGMVVIGLAGLIIGEVLLGKGGRHAMLRGVCAALVGAVLYRIIIAVALSSNLGATNLKLVSAVIVAAAIAWPTVLGKLRFYRQRKKRRGEDA